eukprot:6054353-Pleurochrysis_carterae.AAC.3
MPSSGILEPRQEKVTGFKQRSTRVRNSKCYSCHSDVLKIGLAGARAVLAPGGAGSRRAAGQRRQTPYGYGAPIARYDVGTNCKE